MPDNTQAIAAARARLNALPEGDAGRANIQQEIDQLQSSHTPPVGDVPPGGGGGGTQSSGGAASGTSDRISHDIAFQRTLANLRSGPDRRAANSMHRVPTLEQIRGLVIQINHTSVASRSQVEAVAELWSAAGANNVGEIALEIALCCVHNGSSPKTLLPGMSTVWPGQSLANIAGFIRTVCSLRSFCMYYAKIVWAVMLERNVVPANWGRLGYKEEHKMAAFDFFLGVINSAALEPDSMLRNPTHAEIEAHKAASRIAICDTQRSEGIAASTDIRVTGGRIGMAQTLQITGPDD